MIVGLLSLCRLFYIVPMSLTYLLTVYYARGGQMDGRWAGAWLSTAAMALVLAGAYVLNDVFDVAVDRVNAPGRAIADGRVPRRVAAAIGMALTVGGLALAAACQAAFWAALTAVAAGLALYNTLSKRLGVGKQAAVATLMISIYPLAIAQAGGAIGPRAASLIVFPVWLWLTSFAYELLKDLRDAPGDRQAARGLTPAQRHPALWRRVAGWTIAGATPLLIGPALLGCGWVYVIGAAAGAAVGVASAFVSVRRAIALAYVECFLVAVAAAADVVILGM